MTKTYRDNISPRDWKIFVKNVEKPSWRVRHGSPQAFQKLDCKLNVNSRKMLTAKDLDKANDVLTIADKLLAEGLTVSGQITIYNNGHIDFHLSGQHGENCRIFIDYSYDYIVQTKEKGRTHYATIGKYRELPDAMQSLYCQADRFKGNVTATLIKFLPPFFTIDSRIINNNRIYIADFLGVGTLRPDLSIDKNCQEGDVAWYIFKLYLYNTKTCIIITDGQRWAPVSGTKHFVIKSTLTNDYELTEGDSQLLLNLASSIQGF